MQIEDISAPDLENLKGQGYTEADLAMLADTEVQSLLASSGGTDDDNKADPHAAAADAQDAQAKAAAEAAAAAAAAVNAAADTTTAAEPAAATIKPSAPSDADAQLEALRAERDKSLQDLMDGVIDTPEHQKNVRELEDKIDAIKTAQISDRVAQDMAKRSQEQQEEEAWRRAEKAAMDLAKADGLDYKAKPGLLAAFNVNLKALAADEKNAKRDGAWFLAEADRMTRADIGFKKSEQIIPGKVDNGELPPTLRGAPVAATGAVNSDEFAHMRALEAIGGVEYERAFAALTDKQRDRYMEQ